MVEPSGHCPYLGLKQNQAIRFASPTAEHRCYVTGQAQEIPVVQANYCLSTGHINCPLYIGLSQPTTPLVRAKIDERPLASGGLTGWMAGLAPRDRLIYTLLVGLLFVIFAIYAAAGVSLLLTGGPANDPTSPVPPVASATLAPSATLLPSATFAPSAEPRSPSPTTAPTAAPSPTSSASPTAQPSPIELPTTTPAPAVTYIPLPPTDVPPTAEPPSPTTEPATAEPPSPTAEPATAEPSSPTAEPATAEPASPTAEPATAEPPSPTAEPATAEPPSPTAEPPTPQRTDLPLPPTIEPTIGFISSGAHVRAQTQP